jgi:hypothetical protein
VQARLFAPLYLFFFDFRTLALFISSSRSSLISSSNSSLPRLRFFAGTFAAFSIISDFTSNFTSDFTFDFSSAALADLISASLPSSLPSSSLSLPRLPFSSFTVVAPFDFNSIFVAFFFELIIVKSQSTAVFVCSVSTQRIQQCTPET